MARFLVNCVVKTHESGDWNASHVAEADTVGGAIEAAGDKIEPPDALRESSEDVWYFRMEVVKQG